MTKKAKVNIYKDGILIHRPEWENKEAERNFTAPLNHQQRRAMLSKSNLKKVYRKLYGDAGI